MTEQVEQNADPKFPFDDSLCERCGYPLFGLSIESACPECGLAVAESSPARRDLPGVVDRLGCRDAWRMACRLLVRPADTFRRLDVSPRGAAASTFLFWMTFLAGFVWLSVMGAGLYLVDGGPTSGNLGYQAVFHLVAVLILVQVLTHIEMLGVAAISRRRGWRVPLRLAERVCAFASVGWLPGVALAAVGAQLLGVFAVGEPWFERMHGVVRVSWLCYAGLFVLSLLWFESLVWVGVRQVKYANAWPQTASGAVAGQAPGEGSSPPDPH
ncbi:MAG: hypothetical protein ACE37H_15100 [Phycisphaeraceae bacterium]